MKINYLKIGQLNKAELRSRQMNSLKGGGPGDNSCNCGCASIPVVTNRDANADYGYQNSTGYGDLSDYGDGSTTCECINNSTMATLRAY
jgi:natural product precursor